PGFLLNVFHSCPFVCICGSILFRRFKADVVDVERAGGVMQYGRELDIDRAGRHRDAEVELYPSGRGVVQVRRLWPVADTLASGVHERIAKPGVAIALRAG